MLGGGVIAFAERVVADAALRIDEVVSRPITVLEGPLKRIIVVDRYWKADF